MKNKPDYPCRKSTIDYRLFDDYSAAIVANRQDQPEKGSKFCSKRPRIGRIWEYLGKIRWLSERIESIFRRPFQPGYSYTMPLLRVLEWKPVRIGVFSIVGKYAAPIFKIPTFPYSHMLPERKESILSGRIDSLYSYTMYGFGSFKRHFRLYIVGILIGSEHKKTKTDCLGLLFRCFLYSFYSNANR